MQVTPKAETGELAPKERQVHFRDDFYRDGFRLVLLSLAMTVTAIGLFIIISLYFFLHQVLPVTFPVYEDWRVQADVPLERSYLRIPDLLQWVSQVLPSVLAIDFINYRQDMKARNAYFTSNGWAQYLKILATYLPQDEISKNKEFVAATPMGAPVVLNQGILGGKYGWWVQMPMDVRYSGIDGSNRSKKLIIQVLVVRVPTLNNLDGVAIENLIVNQG